MKSIHVKLTKEQHTALREKLFLHGITMQDLFREAAESVLDESERSDKFLQKIAKKKLRETLDMLSKKNQQQLGDFDSETLYSLLDDSNGSKSQE